MSDLFIQQLAVKIIVWDIDNKIHKCQKYVHLNLYLSDVLAEMMSLVHIIWNIYLIDDFWTNLLIEMNIIDSEQISINISSWRIIIEECQDFLIIIDIISPEKCSDLLSYTNLCLNYHICTVYIFNYNENKKTVFFNDQDLVFNSFYQEVSDHIVNTNLFFIYIQNDLIILIILFCYTKLEIIIEYKKEGCYTDNIENFEFVTLYLSKCVDMSEICLFNNIIIYRSRSAEVAVFIAVIKTYLKL